MENKKIKVRELLLEFVKDLDENLKYFCKIVRKDLRDEKDYVIAITGYPGMGKSQLAAIIAILIDYDYSFEDICFIPTSKEIENRYMNLPMYSIMHIDEASRGLHKQKWYDKVQQKLNELYDTEREDHFLCTLLLMPRFQNFTENFRNFRIKYWINIVDRGLAIVYKRDEDKDSKDPWHLDENYKLKQKRWRNRRIYDRDVPSLVKMEQSTVNYWFYFQVPEIPKEVWEKYQVLKKESRKVSKESGLEEVESHKEKLDREKMEKWRTINSLRSKGKTYDEISAFMKCSPETIRRNVRMIEAYSKVNGNIEEKGNSSPKSNSIIFNPIELDNLNSNEVK